MAEVYLAYDTFRRCEVALKVPKTDYLATPAGRQRFRDEARIAHLLCHPNCCQVLDYYEPGSTNNPIQDMYLVLPFYTGGTLQERLRKTTQFDCREAVNLTLALARILAHVHSKLMIHADLKPSNILFADEANTQPILADFGLARDLSNPAMPFPARGDPEGTEKYMAPEQFDPQPNQQIGPACDIWALGVIFYEVLTGLHPFALSHSDDQPTVPQRLFHLNWLRQLNWLFGRSDPVSRSDAARTRPLPLRTAILRNDPDAPSRLRQDIPKALDRICLRALEKSVHKRYASAEEMIGDLERFLGQAPPPRRAVAYRPLDPKKLQLQFVPINAQAPMVLHDTLYLDVGRDVRPGVIDHHHIPNYPGSAATMVMHRRNLLDLSRSQHSVDFTLVLHEHPDLDALLSAYLARYYLVHGDLPEPTAVLCDYLDLVDIGYAGFTLKQPFTLYTGFRRLIQLAANLTKDPTERWRWAVNQGFRMLDFLVEQAPTSVERLLEIDVYNTPGLFTQEDRDHILEDRQKYRDALKNPACAARMGDLHFMGQDGSVRDCVPALFVRCIRKEHSPEGCQYGKDWARTDTELVQFPRPGFVAFSEFIDLERSESGEGKSAPLGRAILSVTPTSRLSLRGLGRDLEAEESRRRLKIFGRDSRVADPWYDGKSHNFTIVDAPRCGSVLTADEIEAVFLRYGQGEATRFGRPYS